MAALSCPFRFPRPSPRLRSTADRCRRPDSGRLLWPSSSRTLLAFNLPPSATFLNQAVAFIGWGIFVFVLAAAPGVLADLPWRGPQRNLLGALALMALAAAAAAPFWARLAVDARALGARHPRRDRAGGDDRTALTRAGRAEAAFHAFAAAPLLATGVIGAAIGFVQVLARGGPTAC